MSAAINAEEAHAWRLLGKRGVGRIAIRVDDGVDIFPINYLVHDHAIYFRSGPGSKLIDLTIAPALAFETDGRRFGTAWSVVVKGIARRLGFDDEIEKSGIMELRPQDPDDKFNYVRIEPVTVSARTFRRKVFF